MSFCIIGHVHLLPSKFTTEYESVILKGTAYIHLDEKERMEALHLLVNKLSADFKDIGYKYCEKSFHRVNIIRVDIDEYSGKRYIDTQYKYYFGDIGLRNARINFRQNDDGHLMENMLYNELRILGYRHCQQRRIALKGFSPTKASHYLCFTELSHVA